MNDAEDDVVAILLSREGRKQLLPLLKQACRTAGYDDVLPEPVERFKRVTFVLLRGATGAWRRVAARLTRRMACDAAS